MRQQNTRQDQQTQLRRTSNPVGHDHSCCISRLHVLLELDMQFVRIPLKLRELLA